MRPAGAADLEVKTRGNTYRTPRILFGVVTVILEADVPSELQRLQSVLIRAAKRLEVVVKRWDRWDFREVPDGVPADLES